MKPQFFTLSNGLRVVLEENHSAPVLSFNALVLVGSADERDDEAGISHLIEHMLFKGTAKRKVGEIAKDVEAAGGDINAYTSFDQTVYYINMAKRFADKGLEILSDAVQNPGFDAPELEKEKEVILEEIRRSRDNPARHVGEILFQKAYQQHTYRRPIIGFEKTVKAISRDTLFQFYRRWYIPQNIVFVVVGDFESEEMLKKIEQAFARSTIHDSRSTIHDSRFTRSPEPPQLKPYVEIQPDNIQSLYFNLGFHIPQITHADIPPLDILSHILGGAESSRLEQVLKEKKRLVQAIYAYAYSPKDPGLFLVGGQLNTMQASPAFQCLWEEIEKIKREGVTPKELKRAKLNIRSNEIYEKETVGGQAGKLAYFLATAESLDFEEKYYQHIQNVGVDEVIQAANRYLLHTNMTAALLVPQKDYGKAWSVKMGGLLREPGVAHLVSRNSKKRETKEIEYVKLSNGIRVILKEDPSLPIIAGCLVSLGGLLAETKENNGVHHLLATLLTKGTKKQSAFEVAQAIESMAGHLEGFSGKNSTGLKTEFLSEYLQEGLDLFCECLLTPAFHPDEVDKEKKLTLEAIKNQEDALSTLAFIHFQKTLFPNHPYGLRTLGSRQSVLNVSPSQLKNAHQKLLTGKNMVMSLVGDFSAQEVIKILENKLKTISSKKYRFQKPPLDPKPKKIQKVVIPKKEKEQAHVVLGFMGTTLDSPDHPCLVVLTNILSGMGGRLFLNLRDKMSLAYSVSCAHQDGVHPGYFAVYMGTEPSKVPVALKEIEKELQKISQELVSKEELERTQNYLVGTYELELQKNMALAQAHAFNELYGLGFEEVRRYPEKILRVTREDVLRVAKKYIDLEAHVLTIVQP